MSYGRVRTGSSPGAWRRAGHEVRLVAMRAPGYDHAAAPEREVRRGVSIERLSDVAFLDPSRVRRAVRDLRPDALVGSSLYGSAALVPVAVGLPFWADQFGHAMAEAQAKASLEGRNWPVAHTWGFLAPVLRTADRLSVVSERQRYAAIGELGAVGRLTRDVLLRVHRSHSLRPRADRRDPPRAPGPREGGAGHLVRRTPSWCSGRRLQRVMTSPSRADWREWTGAAAPLRRDRRGGPGPTLHGSASELVRQASLQLEAG
jgi:hypothetical protein